MQITISKPRSDGKVEVRDSLGGLMICNNNDEAVVYARGLTDGYNAAKTAIGHCHGFQFAS